MPEQPWLPFYGDIPATIPYPDLTLFELLEKSAEEYAGYTAVEFLGTRLTYRRLRRLALSAAGGLWALGVRPGDRLALFMPNTPHAIVLLYAANRLGVVVTLIHAQAGPSDVAARLADFGPNWIAVNAELVAGLMRLLSRQSVRGIVICDYADFARPRALKRMQRTRHRYRVDMGGIRGPAARHRVDGEASNEPCPSFSWKSLVSLGDATELPAQRGLHGPDDLAVVLYTGGTTGNPTGVMHADRQLMAVAMQTQVQGPLLAGQTLLSVVPFSHGYGVAIAVHATVSAGATTVVLPHSTPRSLARAIRKHQPEYLIGVPSTYAGLVLDRVFRRTRHRSLMGAFCGGDRLPRSIRDRFEQIVRRRGGAIPVREGYGLTETVTACATMPDGEIRPGSVGIPYPDTLIAIARPDRSRHDDPPDWLGRDELGEILVAGPTVMLGYWRRDEATAHALHPDEEGMVWLRTGDLGRMDRDGFVYFVERMGRSLAIGSTRVHPGLTELALNEHEEVLEASVAFEETGSQLALTAHVVAVDSDLDSAWLEQHLRESLQVLDRHQQPDRYTFHDRLPRTLAGVIDQHRLGVEPARPRR